MTVHEDTDKFEQFVIEQAEMLDNVFELTIKNAKEYHKSICKKSSCEADFLTIYGMSVTLQMEVIKTAREVVNRATRTL